MRKINLMYGKCFAMKKEEIKLCDINPNIMISN